MNGFPRHTFAQLLFLLLTFAGAPSLAQDHIVDLSGNVIPGKVTEPFIRRKKEFIPADRINFRADGERGVKSYAPANIKGYYLHALGVFHAAKFFPQQEKYILFPEYTAGEDQALFESATGLEVKSTGKIKLYKAVYWAYQTSGMGTGGMASTATVSYFVEKDGRLLLISPGSWNQQQDKQVLAPFIQNDPVLTERWLYRENKLTGEFLEECISRYNGTYTPAPINGMMAGDTDKMNGF
jgi:hypothetical protein